MAAEGGEVPSITHFLITMFIRSGGLNSQMGWVVFSGSKKANLEIKLCIGYLDFSQI